MLRYLVLLALLAPLRPLAAQVVSQVDFTDVKQRTTDPASPVYFPRLLARLQAADSTLRKADYYYLYYGQVFASGYAPYAADDISKEFLAAYDAKQNERALAIGLPELMQHPFNLKLRNELLVCYSRLQNRPDAVRLSRPFFALLYTIIGSGDGHSAATAFVSVAVADEYAVLGYYGLNYSQQSLMGVTDVFDLTAPDAPPRDEQHTFTGKQIYFDASRSLLSLQKELGGKK